MDSNSSMFILDIALPVLKFTAVVFLCYFAIFGAYYTMKEYENDQR